MGDNKITDLATQTVNSDVATKKYVDDQNANKISDISVVNESFTAGSDGYVSASAGSTHCLQSKLLTSHMEKTVEKHFHLTYSGRASGFSAFCGHQIIAFGGFDNISGRCSFCNIKV